MAESLSVTKVKLAFECPRLFYLGHRFGGMTMFVPAGKTIGLGRAFHNLSSQFATIARQDSRFQDLFKPEADRLEVGTIAEQMQQLFYEQAFYPYLEKAIANDASQAPALLQLWQGLIGLIQRWAELLVNNRRFCSADEVIRSTFLAQELSVEHTFTLPNGKTQLVKGKFDSLVYDFTKHRLCVVEYKTYQAIDRSAQLAQVALYGYMLREKIGLQIDSAVYSVMPDWQEITFSWQQLKETVHKIIPDRLAQMQTWLAWEPGKPEPPPPTSQPNLLCPICPQFNKCQSFFPAPESDQIADSINVTTDKQKAVTAKTSVKRTQKQKTTKRSPRLPDTGSESSIDATAIGRDLVAALQSFGTDVEYVGAAIAPAFIRIKLKPQAGVRVNSILRLTDDLRVQLGLNHPPLISPQAGYVSVDLPRPDRQTAYFEQYVNAEDEQSTGSCQIAIGVDLEGKLVEADLSNPNTCHFLVGGTTGSGKSEFLRSLLLSLTVRHSADLLKIALVDPKRVTFPEFERMPWLYSPVVKDSDRAVELMQELVDEMDNRYQKFEIAKCAEIGTYNQQHFDRLIPRIICIFDEYADFMSEKEVRIELEHSIKRLGAMARAAGIHLIVATQRPEARVVTPIIRSNLPGRVALRTASDADSAIVLGGKQTDAVNLLGKGDLLYLSGAQLMRLQSLFARDVTTFLSS
nr:DNA translocase FtsK [Pseudanabaena sp. PCC 7367]